MLTARRLATIVALGAMVFVQGCAAAPQSAAPQSAAPSQGGLSDETFTMAMGFDPRSLDPAKDQASYTLDAIRQLYDGLVVKTPDGEFHPALATSWEHSADGLTWTFELRHGVTFSDGTPFDAAAAKFSLDRVMDPATASPGASDFVTTISSISAIDSDTLEIVLSGPYAPFLSLMSSSWALMVSPAAVNEYGEDFTSNPVGTGPFILESWQPGSKLTMVRRPDYTWGPSFLPNTGPAHVAKYVILEITEATALAAALTSGDAQMVRYPEPSVSQQLADRGYRQVNLSQPSSPWMFYLNVEKAPTDDLEVRRAIGYAIDTEAIAQAPILRGQAEAVFNVVNPGDPWESQAAVDQFGFHYDPDQAGEILDADGWKMGPDGVRVKNGEPLSVVAMTSTGFAVYLGSTTILEQQLKQVGIHVEVVALPQTTFSATEAEGNQNVAIRSAVGAEVDSLFTSQLSCDNVGVPGNNLSRWCDPDTEEMLQAGRTELDSDKRFAIYAQLQELMLSQALAIPVASRVFTNVFAPEVIGDVYDFTQTTFVSQIQLKSG